MSFSAGEGYGASWGAARSPTEPALPLPARIDMGDEQASSEATQRGAVLGSREHQQKQAERLTPRAGFFFCKATLPPTAYGELFTGRRFLIWKHLQFLYFIVSPYWGVMSTSSPGRRLNSSCCSMVAKKRKTSHRPMDSPRHRLFPKPKTITLSLSVLLILVPAALRNRSGLKVEGSFQSFLEQKGDTPEEAAFTCCDGDSSQNNSQREALQRFLTSPSKNFGNLHP